MFTYFQVHYQDNVIAGFIASSILWILAYFIVLKKILICQETLCLRIGHHKVDGTHYKTCPKHTCPETHVKLKHKHYAKHPQAHKYLNKE